MPVLVMGMATACLFNICSIFIRIIPSVQNGLWVEGRGVGYTLKM